jgi:hypothetical protein
MTSFFPAFFFIRYQKYYLFIMRPKSHIEIQLFRRIIISDVCLSKLQNQLVNSAPVDFVKVVNSGLSARQTPYFSFHPFSFFSPIFFLFAANGAGRESRNALFTWRSPVHRLGRTVMMMCF